MAIQDAVATANILAESLLEGRVTEAQLARVQQRREFPTRVTQTVQVNAHKMFERLFQTDGPLEAPWQLKAMTYVPGLRSMLGYVVGVGVRPEHVAGARKGAWVQPWSLRKAAVHAGAAIGAAVATMRALRG